MEDNSREINRDKTSVFPTKRVRTLCLRVFWRVLLRNNMKSLESNNKTPTRASDGGEDAHPSGQAQGNVALLPSVQDLQFIVVAAGGERLTGLGQTHVHDALAFPNVLQELRRREEETGNGFTGRTAAIEGQRQPTLLLGVKGRC